MPPNTDSKMKSSKLLFKQALISAKAGLVDVIHWMSTLCLALTIGRPRLHEPSKVRILRLDAIGDLILSRPLIETLIQSESLRDKKVELWVADFNLELAKLMWPTIKIVGLKRPTRFSFMDWWRLAKTVSRQRVGLVINLVGSRDFRWNECVSILMKADQRIAPVSDLANQGRLQRWLASWWYDSLLGQEFEVDSMIPEQERQTSFLKAFLQDPDAKLQKTERTKKRQDASFAVLAPSASWAGKCWPLVNFLEVAHFLQDQFGLKVIWLGGPNDHHFAEQILASGFGSDQILIGKTTLPECWRLIENCCLVVSNDSALAHMAATTGTPSVVLLGGGHFGRFFPYPETGLSAKQVCVTHKMVCFHCNWRCPYIDHQNKTAPCVSTIATQEVRKACVEALG